MNWLDKAIAAVAPAQGLRRMAAREALHQFSYDGARMGSERTNAPANTSPNSFDVQRDRLQLMREAEDLERNFAPAFHLNRKYAMFVTPTGYNAQTGDHALNKEVEDYLNNEVFPNCDVSGRFDFFKLLEFAVMGMNRWGDHGFAFIRPDLTEETDPEEAARLPLFIQSVEADRLGGVYQNVVSNDYVSGCVIGDYGRISHYRVFHREMALTTYTSPVDVPASDFVHLVDPRRGDMYRGVSILAPAVTNLRDMYEILTFLKGKQKLASSLTAFTNSMGATVGGSGPDPYATTLSNGQGAMQQDIYYGQINHLPSGADIKFPVSNSPSNEEQALLVMLLKLVAMSYNLPYSFAFDASALGGVSGRLESELAKAEFDRGKAVLLPVANRIKNTFLMDAIAKGIFPASSIDKITKGTWSYRKHPQPDLGKEASANVALKQNGMFNPIAYWAEEGQDPESVVGDMVRWHQIQQNAAESIGADPQVIFGSGASMPSTQSVSINPDEKQDDKKESSKKKFSEGWEENKHPRKKDGEFTPKGAGESSSKEDNRGSMRSARAEVGSLTSAKVVSDGKESKIVLSDGRPLPNHIKPSMIPPAYRQDIQISLDKDSDVWAISRDKDGNSKRVYNPAYSNKQQATKWARVNNGVAESPDLRKQMMLDRNGPNKEEADASWLMSIQATRPGSNSDTKGNKSLWDKAIDKSNVVIEDGGKSGPKVSLKIGDHIERIRDEGARLEIAKRMETGGNLENAGFWLKSFGATTLEGRHVIVEDNSVRLQFMGKEGVWHDHLIRDPKLADMLKSRKEKSGESNPIFDTNYGKVSKYVSSLGSKIYSAKDLRTIRANEIATGLLGERPHLVDSEDDRKKVIKNIATQVSSVLGNRPQQALESYINPAIFDSIQVKKKEKAA